jgi:hypothetical protein
MQNLYCPICDLDQWPLRGSRDVIIKSLDDTLLNFLVVKQEKHVTLY